VLRLFVKKQLDSIMKNGVRFSLLCLFLVPAFFAGAQSNNSHPWISKDVQRVANKNMLENEIRNNTHIEAKSVGYPAVALSKGVHRIGKTSVTTTKGNIVSKGYPDWTISKGVQRIGRK
jgi:hypothetical protein